MAASSRSQHVSKTMTVALRQGHRQEIDHKGSRRCCTGEMRFGLLCLGTPKPASCRRTSTQLHFIPYSFTSLPCQLFICSHLVLVALDHHKNCIGAMSRRKTILMSVCNVRMHRTHNQYLHDSSAGMSVSSISLLL